MLTVAEGSEYIPAVISSATLMNGYHPSLPAEIQTMVDRFARMCFTNPTSFPRV